MSIFVSGALVLAKQHFMTVQRVSAKSCIFKNCSFGWHESTTYENRHKTTTPQLVLWCEPNSKFLKIAILYKIMKNGNMLFG